MFPLKTPLRMQKKKKKKRKEKRSTTASTSKITELSTHKQTHMLAHTQSWDKRILSDTSLGEHRKELSREEMELSSVKDVGMLP
jgi:hypothetical protein